MFEIIIQAALIEENLFSFNCYMAFQRSILSWCLNPADLPVYQQHQNHVIVIVRHTYCSFDSIRFGKVTLKMWLISEY